MTISDEARRLYAENNDEALLRLAIDNWPLPSSELPTGIGEACRLASIRAVQQKRWADSHMWRARALTASVIEGARETAAGLLLQHFFAATATALSGAVGGDGSGHEQARMILDEIKRLVPADTPAWPSLFARLYHEKRALSFLMQSTSGGHPLPGSRHWLDEAEVEYSRALQAAQGQRDVLKVRGGLALVRYLLRADDPVPAQGELNKPLVDETSAIRGAAAGAGYRDVEKWAGINAEVMRRGEFRGWTPYEIL